MEAKKIDKYDFEIAAPILNKIADKQFAIPSDALVLGNVQVLSGPISLSITQTPHAQFVPVPQSGGALPINENKIETIITATFVFPEEFFYRDEMFLYKNYHVHADLAALLALFDYTFVFPVYHQKLAELLGSKDYFWQSLGSVRLDWLGNAKGIQVSVVLLKTHLQEMSNLPITFKEVKNDLYTYVPRFYHSNFLYKEIDSLKNKYVVNNESDIISFKVDRDVVGTRLLRLATNDLNKLLAEEFIKQLGGQEDGKQKLELLKRSIDSILSDLDKAEIINVQLEQNQVTSLSWGYENFLVRQNNTLMPSVNFYQHMGRSPYRLALRFVTQDAKTISNFQRLTEVGNNIQKKLGVPLLPLEIVGLPTTILRNKAWYIQNVLINSIDEYPGSFEVEINLVSFGDLLSFEKIYKIPLETINARMPELKYKVSFLDQFRQKTEVGNFKSILTQRLTKELASNIPTILNKIAETTKEMVDSSQQLLAILSYELAYAQAVWYYLPTIYKDLPANLADKIEDRNIFEKFLMIFSKSNKLEKSLKKLLKTYFENGYLFAIRTLDKSGILSGFDSGLVTKQEEKNEPVQPQQNEKEIEDAKRNILDFTNVVLNKLYPSKGSVMSATSPIQIYLNDTLSITPSNSKLEFDDKQFSDQIQYILNWLIAFPSSVMMTPEIKIILSDGSVYTIAANPFYNKGANDIISVLNYLKKHQKVFSALYTQPDQKVSWKDLFEVLNGLSMNLLESSISFQVVALNQPSTSSIILLLAHLLDLKKNLQQFYQKRGIDNLIDKITNATFKTKQAIVRANTVFRDTGKLLETFLKHANIGKLQPDFVQTLEFVENSIFAQEWNLKDVDKIEKDEVVNNISYGLDDTIIDKQIVTVTAQKWLEDSYYLFVGEVECCGETYKITADFYKTIDWVVAPPILENVEALTFERALSQLAFHLKGNEDQLKQILSSPVSFTVYKHPDDVYTIEKEGKKILIDAKTQLVLKPDAILIDDIQARALARDAMGNDLWNKYSEKIDAKAKEYFVEILQAFILERRLAVQQMLGYSKQVYNETRGLINKIINQNVTLVALYSAAKNILSTLAESNDKILSQLEKTGLTQKIRRLPKVSPHEIYNFGYAEAFSEIIKGIRKHIEGFFAFLKTYGPGEDIWSKSRFAAFIETKQEISAATKALLKNTQEIMEGNSKEEISVVSPAQTFTNRPSIDIENPNINKSLSEISSSSIFKGSSSSAALSNLLENQGYQFQKLNKILSDLEEERKRLKRADSLGITTDVLYWNKNYIYSQLLNLMNSQSPLAKLTPNAAIVFYQIPQFFPFSPTALAQAQILQLAADIIYLSVMSVEITKERYNPVEVAIIRLSNYTGIFEHSFLPMVEKPFASAESIMALLLAPGTDIGVKLGYDSYYHRLPTVFQGFIRDIKPGPVVEIVAESYGAILTRPIFERKETLTKILAGDPRTYIIKALARTGSEKFGIAPDFISKITRNIALRKISDIVELSTNDLAIFKYLRYTPASANLYFPEKYWPKLRHTHSKFWQNFEQYFLNYYVLPGYSAWDVIMDAVKMSPGFIQSVINAGTAKASVFFGKPHYPVFTQLYEPQVAVATENFSIQTMLNTLNRVFDVASQLLDQMTSSSTKAPEDYKIKDLAIKIVTSNLLDKSDIQHSITILEEYGFVDVKDGRLKINEDFINKELISSLENTLKLYQQLKQAKLSGAIHQIQQAKDLVTKLKDQVLVPFVNSVNKLLKAFDLLKNLAVSDPEQTKRLIENVKNDNLAYTLVKYQNTFGSIEPVFEPLDQVASLLAGFTNYLFRFEVAQLDTFSKLYNAERMKQLDKIGERAYQFANKEGYLASLPGTRPFANYFAYSSREILTNMLTLSNQNVANQIVLYAPPWYHVKVPLLKYALAPINYLLSFGNNTTVQPDGHRYTTTIIQFDEDIPPEFLRPKVVYNHFANVPQTRILIGVSELKMSLEEMYEGFIGILGEPTMKPFDYVYIDDLVEDLKGFALVKRVSHVFGPDKGFITTFGIMPYIEVRDVHDSALARVMGFVAEASISAIMWISGINAVLAMDMKAAMNLGLQFAVRGTFGSLVSKTIKTVIRPKSYKVVNDATYNEQIMALDNIYNPVNISPLLKHGMPWVQGIEGTVIDKESAISLGVDEAAEAIKDVWSGLKALVEIPAEYVKAWVKIIHDNQMWNRAVKEVLKIYEEQ